jgi:hypothetical protein
LTISTPDIPHFDSITLNEPISAGVDFSLLSLYDLTTWKERPLAVKANLNASAVMIPSMQQPDNQA